MEVLTDRPKDRFRIGSVVFREGTPDTLTIERADPIAGGPGWWLRFREATDRTAAERLRGVYLEADIPLSDRPSDEVWWHEVVGARVAGSNGRDLGRVVDIYRAGGAEVFVVDGPVGRLEVPAVRAVVTEFKPTEGEIVVDVNALGLDETERQ